MNHADALAGFIMKFVQTAYQSIDYTEAGGPPALRYFPAPAGWGLRAGKK